MPFRHSFYGFWAALLLYSLDGWRRSRAAAVPA